MQTLFLLRPCCHDIANSADIRQELAEGSDCGCPQGDPLLSKISNFYPRAIVAARRPEMIDGAGNYTPEKSSLSSWWTGDYFLPRDPKLKPFRMAVGQLLDEH
jgi:hypothetical protein